MTFLTFFADRNVTSGTIQSADLLKELVSPSTLIKSANKEDLPLFSGAHWPKNSRAAGNEPLSVWSVIVEHDAGSYALNPRAMSYDEAMQRLRTWGIKALIYTSPSHSPEAPRWRIVCGLNDEILPSQHVTFVAALNGVLDGVLASESADIKRAWFYGRCGEAEEYRSEEVEGQPLDVAVLFADFPLVAMSVSPPISPSIDDLDPLAEIEREAILNSVTDETVGDVRSALMHLASIGYGREEFEWAPLAWQTKTIGERGLPIWIEFSIVVGDTKGSPRDALEKIARQKWRRSKARKSTFRTIFTTAQEHGWVNPRAKLAADAETVICKLRQMSRDDVVRQWATMAAPLAKDAAHVVVDEVSRLTGVGVRALGAALKERSQAEQAERRSKRTRERAGARKMIRERVEDRTAQAAEIDAEIAATAAPGEYVRHAGRLARIVAKQMPMSHLIDDPTAAPPETPQIDSHIDVSIRALVEREFVFHTVDAKGADVPQAVPHVIIDTILRQRESAARDVVGVLAHPIVLSDGTIVADPGHHKSACTSSAMQFLMSGPIRKRRLRRLSRVSRRACSRASRSRRTLTMWQPSLACLLGCSDAFWIPPRALQS